MTSNGHVQATVDLGRERPLERLQLEASFRLLGVDVHVTCTSLRQHQYWRSVYDAFAVHAPAHPQVTVRTSGDGRDGTLQARLLQTGAGEQLWDGVSPLLPPVQLSLFRTWVLFAGSIVSHAGHGVLLLGLPGVGKTRLVLTEVARGGLLVADGIVPLSADDLLAHPFPRALRLSREDMAIAGISPSHPSLHPFRTRAGDIQWRADPRALLGSRSARTATEVAAALVLTGPNVAEPGLHSLTEAEATTALLSHLHSPLTRLGPAEDAIRRLVRSVPVLALTPGVPQQTVAELDRFLR